MDLSKDVFTYLFIKERSLVCSVLGQIGIKDLAESSSTELVSIIHNLNDNCKDVIVLLEIGEEHSGLAF